MASSGSSLRFDDLEGFKGPQESLLGEDSVSR
jgi:hypothetical protein